MTLGAGKGGVDSGPQGFLRFRAIALLLSMAFVSLGLPVAYAASEPPLPAGLGETSSTSSSEPALPAGLGGASAAEEPSLPTGLGDSSPTGQTEAAPSLPTGLGGDGEDESVEMAQPDSGGWQLPQGLSGFLEGRIGARLQNVEGYDRTTLEEIRLRTEYARTLGPVRGRLAFDLIAGKPDQESVDLQSGEGWLDLREAWLLARPGDFIDIKAGRQIATWGTGDLLFINDLFPKDWISFLLGRDEDYLKAPFDGVRGTIFSDFANLDLIVGIPFAPDRFVDGDDLAFSNPGGPTRLENPDIPDRPDLYSRLYRTIGSAEVAGYLYDGFWKSPGGFSTTGRAIFPRLAVYGASVRGAGLGGILSFETGYYDSLEDRRGTDPFIKNSEWRFLLGHDREILPKLNLGLQYYVEWLQDYDDYRETLPPIVEPRDEWRQVLTLRLTQLLLRDDLTLSLFTFYSPTDQDFYLRPVASWKVNDVWRISGGLNLFGGESDTTFFGQFEDNSNGYLALRATW